MTVTEPKPKTAFFVKTVENRSFFGATLVVLTKAVSGRSFVSNGWHTPSKA